MKLQYRGQAIDLGVRKDALDTGGFMKIGRIRLN